MVTQKAASSFPLVTSRKQTGSQRACGHDNTTCYGKTVRWRLVCLRKEGGTLGKGGRKGEYVQEHLTLEDKDRDVGLLKILSRAKTLEVF